MSVVVGAAPAKARETKPARPSDLSALTNPPLAGMCRERGIEPPRKATKAQLLALLEA